jgi:ribosomal protein L22
MKPYDPAKRREEYLRNREKYLIKNKEWREKNHEAKKEMSRNFYYKDKIDRPIEYLLKYAKQRAKDKQLPFNLSKEDIVIPEVCPIMGTKFDRADRKTAPSIDRIVPDLGYIKGNVQVISTLANQMKWNSTREELIQFCKGVLLKEGIL